MRFPFALPLCAPPITIAVFPVMVHKSTIMQSIYRAYVCGTLLNKPCCAKPGQSWWCQVVLLPPGVAYMDSA